MERPTLLIVGGRGAELSLEFIEVSKMVTFKEFVFSGRDQNFQNWVRSCSDSKLERASFA